MAQLVATMLSPPAYPLNEAQCRAEDADQGAWLNAQELAPLFGVALGNCRSWSSCHRPRSGFDLKRRKEGSPILWKVD